MAPLGPLQPQGVNPRSLSSNKLWQMNVTHIPSFGKLKYVFVDTYSKLIFAIARSGEKNLKCNKGYKNGYVNDGSSLGHKNW